MIFVEVNLCGLTCKDLEHWPGGSGGILIFSMSFKFCIFLDNDAESKKKHGMTF